MITCLSVAHKCLWPAAQWWINLILTQYMKVYQLCVTWATGCICTVAVFICYPHSHVESKLWENEIQPGYSTTVPSARWTNQKTTWVFYSISQRAKVMLSNYYKTKLSRTRTQTAFIITAIQWVFDSYLKDEMQIMTGTKQRCFSKGTFYHF